MSNKKKMEVLYFVEQYIKRYGYPPTVRDIGKGLGYRSPSTVRRSMAERYWTASLRITGKTELSLLHLHQM